VGGVAGHPGLVVVHGQRDGRFSDACPQQLFGEYVGVADRGGGRLPAGGRHGVHGGGECGRGAGGPRGEGRGGGGGVDGEEGGGGGVGVGDERGYRGGPAVQ